MKIVHSHFTNSHLITAMYNQPNTHRIKFNVTQQLTQDADKSLARPGRKQATATKLTFVSQSKKKNYRKSSVQPILRDSNDLRVGRKMANFQLFFQSGRAKDLSALLYMFPILQAQHKEVSSYKHGRGTVKHNL